MLAARVLQRSVGLRTVVLLGFAMLVAGVGLGELRAGEWTELSKKELAKIDSALQGDIS